MATEVTATDVRRKFASVLKAAVAGERTIITRHGKVLAAVVSAADFEKLQALDITAGAPDAAPAP